MTTTPDIPCCINHGFNTVCALFIQTNFTASVCRDCGHNKSCHQPKEPTFLPAEDQPNWQPSTITTVAAELAEALAGLRMNNAPECWCGMSLPGSVHADHTDECKAARSAFIKYHSLQNPYPGNTMEDCAEAMKPIK